MKLSELLGLTINQLNDMDIFDVDFLRDQPYFVDLENFLKFSNANNVLNTFRNNVAQKAREGNLNEVKGFGLGFSTNEKDGNGPSVNVVNSALVASDGLELGISSLQYLVPLLDKFGPDGLSDLVLIGLDQHLLEESNFLLNDIAGIVGNREGISISTNMMGDNWVIANINGNTYRRKLIKKSYLSSSKEIGGVRGKINDWVTRYNEADPKHQFAAALLNGSIDDDVIDDIKRINFASKMSVAGAMKIAMAYSGSVSQIDSNNFVHSVLNLFHIANKMAITRVGNKVNIEENAEKNYQLAQEMAMVGTSIFSKYEREAERGRGRVDFVVKSDNDIVVIEDKVETFTSDKLIEAINQVNSYAEDPAYEELIKTKAVIFFTDSTSFTNVEEVIDNVRNIHNQFHGIRVMVYRGAPISSSGSNPVTSHLETI